MGYWVHAIQIPLDPNHKLSVAFSLEKSRGLMSEIPQLPSVVDLSFDHSGNRTHFNIAHFDNLDIFIISTIGKIGQIVQVIFPSSVITSRLQPTHNIDYDLKVLLGPPLEDFDLLLNRIIRVLVEHKLRRSFVFALGLDNFNLNHARNSMNICRVKGLSIDFPKLFVQIEFRSFSTRSKCAEFIFLPKTSFKKFVKPRERARLDSELSHIAKFNKFYEWQLNEQTRQSFPIFEILDGPPYANGSVHVGHAINKILKDFILRSQVYGGKRVIFRPGWDCHGLPIELKIAKSNQQKKISSCELRSAARQFALQSISSQENSFRRWAVSADWANPYYTMDKDYVAKEIRIFGELYRRKMIYRAFMPVYWSPSALTALAEAELEYKDHISTAIFYRFGVINSQSILLKCEADERPTKLYALIWTTTPWTLPMNNAIAYRKDAVYVVIELCAKEHYMRPARHLYILAKDLVSSFEKETKIKTRILSAFIGAELKGIMYRSTMFNDLAQPFVEAKHVTTTVGTGLVHISFAHGLEDFELALQLNEEVSCFVDEHGRYMRHLGHKLEGKSVLEEGNDVVLQLFKKNVIFTSPYKHSYPYDWRTRQPVIIRSSEQWFIDISKISMEVVKAITNGAHMIGSRHSDKTEALLAQLKNRVVWCISRQRHWGVPIPAFYREDGSIIISHEIVNAIAERVEKDGTDVWWQYSADELFPEKLRNKYGIRKEEQLKKSDDILDVWMDSGIAWSSTRQRTGPCDLIVEGCDQFRGWFQSLSLISFALNNELPFKNIYVHAFAVDENGEKMSKSRGNVVNPDSITDGSLNEEPYGADGLRLWVAKYGCEGDNARIGPSVMKEIARNYAQLRNSFCFLLGAVNGYEEGDKSSYGENFYIDRYILDRLAQFTQKCIQNHNEFRFPLMVSEYLQFLQHPLNSPYISCIKNRLYCGTYLERQKTQETLSKIGLNLGALLAPILPHLVTEFFTHHPSIEDPSDALRLETIQRCDRFYCSGDPNATELYAVIDFALDIRSKMFKQNDKNDVSRKAVLITGPDVVLQKLYPLQADPCSYNSELVEILGVSEVKMETDNDSEIAIHFVQCDREFCKRCRRNVKLMDEDYCERCRKAVKENEIMSKFAMEV
ncbi:unnamed protein product [Thelazia callipaeda]|uniref:isoleucine--tRNA ligase n=1 Tax=Thelazia callipaeda TaxID=103827 RepID=A0A0N5CZM1_THECL|nr:unnamed protein product [Thelazia callipaeda]